jgi:hypothetical protein
LLPLEQSNGYRIALPINVYDRPDSSTYRWRYSGMHMLQVDGLGGQTPQLSLAGVIKTAEPDGTHFYPPHAPPNRAVLHDDSVFVVSGDALIGSLWDRLPSP